MYSPVDMAAIFLDNAAELARAHRASYARTTRCSYIRQPEPPQTSRTCPYVDKNGCVLSPPFSPPLPTKSIYRDWIDRLLPVESPLSLSKIRGLAGQRHISFMFLRLYRPVIYRARANIQLKEGSGFSGRG